MNLLPVGQIAQHIRIGQLANENRAFLGDLSLTPGAHDMITKGHNVSACLERYVQNDWGEISEADKQRNADALVSGDRLLAAYNLGDGDRLYIITEWDRSYSTIMLPGEY